MAAPDAFKQGLLEALPGLRAFARSLAHDPDTADDLVQETMARAWEKHHQFQEGTNLRAWLFTILRNTFYSRTRKASREVEDPEGLHAQKLSTPPAQLAHIEFQDFLGAFEKLSPEHREALMLVGASGLAYDEAAAVCGVAVGTMKSRVNRARAALAARAAADDGVAESAETSQPA